MRMLWVMLCTLLCATSVGASKSYGDPKNILVIESYHKDFIWDAKWIKGLEDKLQSKGALTYFEMDTKRLPENQFENQAIKAFEKYQQVKPDLVVIGDDNALRLVGPKLINERTPIVYLGINNNPRNYFKSPPKNMTGVLERPLYKRSVSFIKQIHPNAKKILLMFDASFTSQSVKSDDSSFRGQSEMEVGGVTMDLKNVKYWDEWQSIINDAKGNYDALVMGLTNTIRDRKTDQHVPTEEVIRWTMTNTKIPPYSFWDTTIGNGGTIGGYVLYGEKMGHEAGNIILKVLAGTPPSEIRPTVIQEGRLLFDRKELKRWNISLPKTLEKEADFIGEVSAH